jgi:hypothetical protein
MAPMERAAATAAPATNCLTVGFMVGFFRCCRPVVAGPAKVVANALEDSWCHPTLDLGLDEFDEDDEDELATEPV